MESVTAVVAGGLAFALSYYIGRTMASSIVVAAMMGAACGLAFSVVFFLITVSVGAVLPGMFDGWLLGVHFIGMLILVPLGCAAVAALEYWHLGKVEARRLPF
ncbi:hypothetical protein BH11PSE3_BH11PSE3_01480 [soil metagenome]